MTGRRSIIARAGYLTALAATAAIGGACSRGPSPAPAPSASVAASTAPPVDRLAPGELALGRETLHGIPLPRKMKVEHRSPKAVMARGKMAPGKLAKHVSKYLSVRDLELAKDRIIFPRVAITGGPAGRVYRIEIYRVRAKTNLYVKDITPLPSQKGLTEEQRWKQVGMTKDGKLLPSELY